MIKYLVVILEHAAAPFCCYETDPGRPNLVMPLELLSAVVDHAIRNGICINFLYGATPLPAEYQQLIESVDHIKMMPPGQEHFAEGAVLIIDDSNIQDADGLEGGELANIILRVGSGSLGALAGTVRRLNGRFKRLNIILKDIGGFREDSFRTYRDQLEEIRELVAGEYRRGNFIEINTVTDRLFLTNMNNCGAGIEHLTVAPDGRYYLCPAFYHDREDRSLGEFGEAPGIGNSRLLELENAPICRNCDAYQCKRCIYLNRKLTLELNTPSRQQCTVAHLERNTSRELLSLIRAEFDGSDVMAPIPELDYLDPFDVIASRAIDAEARERHFAELLSKPLEAVPVDHLIWQIYQLDPMLLARLKQLNSAAADLRLKDAGTAAEARK